MATENAATLERPAAGAANGAANANGRNQAANLGERGNKSPMTTASLEDSLRTMLKGGEDEETPNVQRPNPKGEGDEGRTETGQELPPGEEGGDESQGQRQEQEQADQDNGEAEKETETAQEQEQDQERTEWPESAQKRVDKLTAQKAELRESVSTLQEEKDELERRLAEAEQQPAAASTPSNPLGFIKNTKELSGFVSTAKATLRNIEDYFDESLDEAGTQALKKYAKDNGAYDEESGEFNPAELKRLRRTVQDALSEYVPQRMEYLKQETLASQHAEQTFPWLKDRKSPEYGLFQEVLQTLPEIRKLPAWKAIGAIYVRGLQVVQAETKAKTNGGKPLRGGNGAGDANGSSAKPGTKANAPGKLPGAGQRLPQRTNGNGNGDTIDALRAKARATKDPKDYEALIRAELNQ